jgi:hypothetical protein
MRQYSWGMEKGRWKMGAAAIRERRRVGRRNGRKKAQEAQKKKKRMSRVPPFFEPFELSRLRDGEKCPPPPIRMTKPDSHAFPGEHGGLGARMF